MGNQVIDLSWRRKKEVVYLDGSEINFDLLNQCAYYPRPPAFGKKESGCVRCSFEKPRENCEYAHILTFTEQKAKIKRKSNLLRLLEQFREEDRLLVEEYLIMKGKEVR